VRGLRAIKAVDANVPCHDAVESRCQAAAKKPPSPTLPCIRTSIHLLEQFNLALALLAVKTIARSSL
jgi:hypothetical protein